MKILAALDQTEYADFVLLKAIKTAKQQNAKLDILVVAEPPDRQAHGGNDDSVSDGGANDGGAADALLEAATAAARRYRQKARDSGLTAKMRVRAGSSPADEIIQYQRAEELDLIVLGRRSRSDAAAFPMGAVAQRVAAYATSTVMVVRCMTARDRSA